MLCAGRGVGGGGTFFSLESCPIAIVFSFFRIKVRGDSVFESPHFFNLNLQKKGAKYEC